MNRAAAVGDRQQPSQDLRHGFTFAGNEFTTTGLQNGETLTWRISPARASPARPMPARIASSSVKHAVGTANLNNYDLSYVPGTLTVNRAAASVIANNQAKT